MPLQLGVLGTAQGCYSPGVLGTAQGRYRPGVLGTAYAATVWGSW